MEISVQRDVPLNVGYKISGRYGNKSVLSAVIPDDQMPMLENGRHFDVILNMLSITLYTKKRILQGAKQEKNNFF